MLESKTVTFESAAELRIARREERKKDKPSTNYVRKHRRGDDVPHGMKLNL